MFRTALMSILSLSLAMPSLARTLRVPTELPTIQRGVDSAAPGDTVLVAPGTYSDFETRVVSGVPISACVFVKHGVRLLSELGPQATIIAAEEPDVIPIRSRGPSAEETRFEGFTIRRESGRAVELCLGGSFVFRRCVFRDLHDPEAGAIRGATLDGVTIESCVFENCHGGPSGAGAIWIHESALTIRDTVFEACEPSAVCVRQITPTSSPLTIEDCTFRDNVGTSGGAVWVENLAAAVGIERCRFLGNVASVQGGAIGITGSGAVTIRENLLAHNRVIGAGFGGALSVTGSGVTVAENTFYGSEQESSVLGGAAIALLSGTGATVVNNVVAASRGAPALAQVGGAAASDCNVFWENSAGDSDGVVLGPRDRVVDPRFCNPLAGIFAVDSSSPCLPENSDGCGQIGAYGLGCGVIGIEATSWGAIKGAYREHRSSRPFIVRGPKP